MIRAFFIVSTYRPIMFKTGFSKGGLTYKRQQASGWIYKEASKYFDVKNL